MPAHPLSLGEFKILRRIGAGGMAEVFLAEKAGAEGISKRLVVKRILPGLHRDARRLAMFVREARLATDLDHPNVVHVYELVDHPADGLLLAMEYVDGADLATVLASVKARGARVPPYVAALIARDAAKGLHYAHQRAGADGAPLEIVHRDVSPQNILLSRDGAVKIADLGIATAALYRDATTGVKGKLRYMAPEQAEGAPLDRRADIYALGVVLYETLRLTSPYGARVDAVREARFEPPLADLTDVPRDLRAILRRALTRDRADRYPTARALADDLSRAIVAQGEVIDEAAIEALVRPVLDAPEAPAAHAQTATVVASTRRSREPAAPTRRLSRGAKVGRYVVEDHLGHGGMADVYAARDTTLDRQVALKILRGATNAEARRTLLREAKLAARFEHPGSVVIYDVGEADGVVFIAMELVRGVPLSTLIGDSGVPLGRRTRWLVGAARALAAAHATGLVHRDVKPGNLMIRDTGEVKVLDFGIARVSADAASRSGEPSSSGGSFVGTLRYAAPERFGGGEVDGRADQFSWAITAWELLAGRHPFEEGDAIDAVGGMLVEGIRSLETAAPDVPIEIARVVDRAASRRPEDRFESLDEAADLLEPFAEAPRGTMTDASRSTLVPAPPSRRDPPAPRRRIAIAAILAAAAFVGALGARRARPITAASTTTAAPSKPMIAALACGDATIDGDAGADLSRAIGMGACARLAPEMGIDWAVPDATHRLDVRATIRGDRTSVTLRLAGKEAMGSAPTPVGAIWIAIAALVPQLDAPAWPPDRIRLWGARDEQSARRIHRVWQHASLRLLSNTTTEILRLIEVDGDSPIPHLLARMNAVGGRDLGTVGERIQSRLDRVPSARADAIRGQLLAFPTEKNRREATRLLREAYAAGADDHGMTASYAVLAARMGLPEAHAVLERLHARAPTQSIRALDNAVLRSADRDEARSAKYVAWIDELLPETRGWLSPAQWLASVGRFSDARAALDLARRLGLDGAAADPTFHADARAQIELAALDPRAAREQSTLLLGDPRFHGSLRGGLSHIASYLQEGRFAEASASMREHAERQRDQGNLGGAVQISLGAMRVARWLDRAPDPVHAELLERALSGNHEIPHQDRTLAQTELALARRAPPEAALLGIEEAAERDAAGDAFVRDRARVLTIALARRARGDRAAVDLFRDTPHAPFGARLAASLDAALALEALGDAKGAEAAYLIAADAANNAEDAAARVLALARLARLHQREGREAEAAKYEARVAPLWAGADPGLRDAVRKMR